MLSLSVIHVNKEGLAYLNSIYLFWLVFFFQDTTSSSADGYYTKSRTAGGTSWDNETTRNYAVSDFTNTKT